jgi:hypothetical protein
MFRNKGTWRSSVNDPVARKEGLHRGRRRDIAMLLALRINEICTRVISEYDVV